MPELTVREARPEDATLLHGYLQTLIAEDLPMLTLSSQPSPVPQLQAYLAQYAKMGNSVFLIALLDGKLVGQLDFAGGMHPRKQHAGGVSVSVHCNFRGQGIGTRLLKALIKWAEPNPLVKRVELEVLSNNPRAVELYARHGFVIEGTKKQAVLVDGQAIDNIMMARLFP